MAVCVCLYLLAGWAAVGWAALPKADRIVELKQATLQMPATPGSNGRLVVAAEVQPGWHINSDHPLNSAFVPTRLSIATPTTLKAGRIIYPPAQTITLPFSRGVKLAVFSGSIAFAVEISHGPELLPGALVPVDVSLQYQPCNDNVCLPPVTISQHLMAGWEAAGSATDAAGATEADSPVTRAFAGGASILGFVLVLLGGLALNLTPCVYPLIGVTLAYFGNQSGSVRRIAVLAVCYVLGIALTFSIVGTAVALSGGLFGAAMANPIVLASLATILLLLAASSFGLFSLAPPAWMMRWAGAARPGLVGSVAMGIGMGVVAAPCIGPFVLGLLLLVERSGSPLFGFSLFFTLALGMGLPYLVLAFAAGHIRQLPRSGDWLAWIEQFFGFVLVGLALYFLDPLFPNRLMTRLLPYYAVAAGIFLGFLTPVGRSWRPFWVFRTMLGVVSVLALIYLVRLRQPRTMLAFHPFSPAQLEAARAERKPVLVDFSADWCIPCREMEATTFTDPTVVREAQRFVRLRADLTLGDYASRQLVRRYAIQGVPTLMLVDSTGKLRKQVTGYVDSSDLLRELHRLN